MILQNIKTYSKIPKSMGIAQALVESATGTSRFAREANNLFGEWTWGEKGLIPDLRHPDKNTKLKFLIVCKIVLTLMF